VVLLAEVFDRKVTFNGTNIKTETQINVLDVVFDSKLSWKERVAQTLTKLNRALNAFRLI
jgi:hypothetical protein